MKSIHASIASGFLVIVAVTLLSPQTTQAQGEITYLSDLGQPSTGSLPVGSDSWQAATFYIGNNASGYMLNSVQLMMTDASGSPSGFNVLIYRNNPAGLQPLVSIGSLTGPVDPSTAGIYTYTPTANITFPGRDPAPFFIVVTDGTTVGNSGYNWSLAGANSYNPSGGWSYFTHFFTSNDGIHWDLSMGGSGSLQFAINATAIPEPSPVSLLLLGTGILFYVRRRK
jgi:hypothetical protein